MTSLASLLEHALDAARRHGAEQADIMIVREESRSALIRHGKTEGIRHSEEISLGLRVFHGQRMALVSGNDLSSPALEQLAERACAMACLVPESPYDGLAEHPLLQQDMTALAALELDDQRPLPAPIYLLEQARRMEDAALSAKDITNSNGASSSSSRAEIALATSTGFSGQYSRSHYGLGVSVVAGQGDAMERDYASRSALFHNDLPLPETLGQEAAARAIARLNPHPVQTGIYPVVFERRVAGSLLGHLASAVNGSAIARGTSFLCHRQGQRLFGDTIRISDDPTLPRGLGSRPFDAEGCTALPLDLVEGGILHHWLLDSRCARELRLHPNGRALRTVSSTPSPGTSNLFLHPGTHSPHALQSDIVNGVLITEMMGNALNMLTGDYSRGASGFMIRHGAIAEPVAGLTVAGNLCDMFARLHPANDLHLDFAINAPTVRIDGLTIAGR